jgi:hypothetical protein
VSQSAASQHLQELAAAWHRAAGQVDTSGGADARRPPVLEYCRDVVRRHDEFEAALAELKAEVEGAVRVASIYSVGLWQMSQLKAEFQKRYPKARLAVEYLRPEKVYEAVLADRADLGLVSYPVSTRELAVLPWREERMVVAAAPSHPLARRGMVRPADLNGCEFVAFDRPAHPPEIDRFLQEGVEVGSACTSTTSRWSRKRWRWGGGDIRPPPCSCQIWRKAGCWRSRWTRSWFAGGHRTGEERSSIGRQLFRRCSRSSRSRSRPRP